METNLVHTAVTLPAASAATMGLYDVTEGSEIGVAGFSHVGAAVAGSDVAPTSSAMATPSAPIRLCAHLVMAPPIPHRRRLHRGADGDQQTPNLAFSP